MTRQQFRDLAELRRQDAAALLDASRWSAAYYLTGYAVECGLKACVMKVLRQTQAGVLFDQGKGGFQQKYCLTHKLADLLRAVELAAESGSGGVPATTQSFIAGFAVQPRAARWAEAKKWTEVCRYGTKTQSDAENLYTAVTDPASGILPWIKQHW